MARSIYFSEQVRSEQSLYEDIVIEALKIYGYDMYYLPRDIVNRDDLLNEDVSSRFNSAYMIEMYVDNIEGFDGQGDIFQKFGVEIRDNVTLTMSRRRWNQAIKRHDNELTSERPLEGDLVYVPFSRKLFQIMRVEHEQPFYQVTNLPTYKLYCELYEFSGDDFDTEVAVIDQIERSYAYKYIISFTGGTNATATATLDSDDRVAQFIMTNTGSGYTGVPEITISPPDQSPRTASFRVNTDNNQITSIDIIDSGNFYLLPPDLLDVITPVPEFAMFGDRSLQHDSAGARYLGYVIEEDTTVVNNRMVIRFFYWTGRTGQDYNNLLYFSNNFYVYHRTADNKIVVHADGADSDVVSSQFVGVFRDSGDSANYWNYVELSLLNSNIKINLNGESGEIQSLNGWATNFTAGTTLYAGAPLDSGSLAGDSITTSFIGFIDQLVVINSGDDAFDITRPVPNEAADTERDDATLVLGTFIEDFNHTKPILSASINSGRLEEVTIGTNGTGLRDSSYTITCSDPEGTAADFTATATATIVNRQITRLEINFGGSGYTTPPTVTIAPQGANVIFAANDKVFQTLSDGTVLEADVIKFSDSDYKIHVVNVQSSDGKYHDFQTDALLHKDSVNSTVAAFVVTVEEVNQLSQNEQNSTFSTEAAEFLDFSENNPFGDPENN